jgi:hypothetical protein
LDLAGIARLSEPDFVARIQPGQKSGREGSGVQSCGFWRALPVRRRQWAEGEPARLVTGKHVGFLAGYRRGVYDVARLRPI